MASSVQSTAERTGGHRAGNGSTATKTSTETNGSSEAIDELTGTGMEGTVDEVGGEEAFPGGHTPVSHTIVQAGAASTGTGAQAADTESGTGDESQSEYETVSGWSETSAMEADPSVEATVDASQAEAGEEFFQFLAPLILPLAKAVLPQLAGAAAQAGSSALRGLLNRRLAQIRTRIAGRREAGQFFAGDGESTLLAEASAEALAQMEVVIGTDDRVQVTDTRATPWNRICHLRIVAANGSVFLGTGFLIGRRSVVTAGHCVYLHNNGGWARSIEVSPGRNGEVRPFGRIMAAELHSVRGWTVRRARSYDYGFIRLAQTPSPFPGAFGVRAETDAVLRNKRLNTAGYPGDKAQSLPGSMWFHGRRATSLGPTTITYDIDTAGGQSGSAVWTTSGGVRTVVGIHTNGAPSGNSATRITAPVLANLTTWRQAAT